MDDATAIKLFASIVSFVVEHDSFVTKTKLLKLLYLFDVEYFRVNRRTFTQFEWKFFHLGPWCAEYNDALDNVIASGAIISKSLEKYETLCFYPEARTETAEAFANLRDEMILRRVLQRWARETTAKILDFVYFETEPMQSAVRNCPLDFSTIATEQSVKYIKTPSAVPTGTIRKKRAAFEAKRAKGTHSYPVQLTPAQYDDDFYEAMKIIDAEG